MTSNLTGSFRASARVPCPSRREAEGHCQERYCLCNFLKKFSVEAPKGVVATRGWFQNMHLVVPVVSQNYWSLQYFERGRFKDVISWFPWLSWLPAFLWATPLQTTPFPHSDSERFRGFQKICSYAGRSKCSRKVNKLPSEKLSEQFPLCTLPMTFLQPTNQPHLWTSRI